MDEAKPDMKPQSAKSKRDILDEVMIETKAPSARSNKSHDSKAWSSDSGDVDMDFGFKTKYFSRDLLSAYWERFKLKHVLPW